MRRQYEPEGVIRYLKKNTINQPNYRMFRALRTLQGLDNVLCLRGVQSIAFWDHTKWLRGGHKCRVRDKSFVLDVSRAVQKRKSHTEFEQSRLRSLQELLPDFNPNDDVWWAMACGLDELGTELDPIDSDEDDLDLNDNSGSDVDASSSSSSSSGSDQGSDSDSGSGSDDDDDDNGGQEFERGSGGLSVSSHNQVSTPRSLVSLNLGARTEPIDLSFEDDGLSFDDTDSSSEENKTITSNISNFVDLTIHDQDSPGDGNGPMVSGSSQTIQDHASPKSEPVSVGDEINSPRSEDTAPSTEDARNNSEGSLFVSNDADVVELTEDIPNRGRESRSPREAIRAIEAHVRTTPASEASGGRNPQTESSLFLSPTQYGDIVPSTSTGPRTEISSISSLMRRGQAGDSAGASDSGSSESGQSKRSYAESCDLNTEDGSRKRARSEQSPSEGSSRGSACNPIEL